MIVVVAVTTTPLETSFLLHKLFSQPLATSFLLHKRFSQPLETAFPLHNFPEARNFSRPHSYYTNFFMQPLELST